MFIRILGKEIGMGQVYILMISDGRGHASATPFSTYKLAEEYTSNLEEAQKYIEGNAFKGVKRYTDRDLIVPPFFNDGKLLYCSIVCTLLRGEEYYTWRAIYEQKMLNGNEMDD